ncbi:MAG TPA: Maf family protein [Blastocatellia bacterium]|nr:Maf family protein [Blastocatellia bacterium]
MRDKQNKIILASSSPRRAEILQKLGVEFEILPSKVSERPHPNEAPPDYITRISRAKVVSVARTCERGLVIGADTVVVLKGTLLGKPQDKEDAARMLRELSGNWHAVMTGIALYDVETRKEVADYEKTLVRFAKLSEEEIEWYVNTGEPMDKAGAYGIQGFGGVFVEEIAGNYFNVVGLPIPLLYRLARRLGYSLLSVESQN